MDRSREPSISLACVRCRLFVENRIPPVHNKTSPLRIHRQPFGSTASIGTRRGYRRRLARCHRGFALRSVTSLHWPRLPHYYGIICHLTSRHVSRFLSCLLKQAHRSHPDDSGLPDDARLPQLLCWLPVDDYVLNHLLSLSMNRASCLFAHSPRQPAESGSLTLRSINLLSLPSDPAVGQRRPCESDSLPHGRGEVADKQRRGLPASLGKQKSRQGLPGGLVGCCYI
jgi:hypothetical protein